VTTATLDPVEIVQSLGLIPETFWNHEDDACDCTFQRIGMWKNPYLGETLEVRMCCIWAELYKLFPQHVRVTPAYLVDDKEWDTRVREWDGESDMPESIWYRHYARKHGVTVAEARKVAGKPPKGTPRPVVEQEPTIDPVEAMLAMCTHLAERITELEARLENSHAR
jgi:hypothetical protein